MTPEENEQNENTVSSPDRSNPYQMYCWEFQQSIKEFSEDRIDNGNWFGRVVAFKSEFKITNVDSTQLNREQFTKSIVDGNLVISDMITDFPGVRFVPDDSANKCLFQHGKIYSQASLVGRLNGIQVNGKFDIVHVVKPAFQTKATEFKKLAS